LQHERLVRGIAKGAGVVFAGTILARILGYVIRAVIARFYGPEGYGFVSTALAFFTIASTIVLLGFGNSLPRQIAFYFKKSQTDKIKSLVYSAYFISTILGTLIGSAVYYFSEEIALQLFADANLIPFFRYFAAGIIFFAWIRLAASIFKAYKRMVWYILLQDVLRYSAILIAVISVILLNKPVHTLGLSYLLAFIVVGLFGSIYAVRSTPINMYSSDHPFSEIRTLFDFSWPLMIASIIYLFLYRVDTLMIGFFLDQTNVGIYNAAVPIGQLLTIVITSFTPFLLPVMTEYFASDDKKNLDTTFSISTKWIFLLTIPGFALLFFFPDFFLRVIFGSEFVVASPVLRIISLGFLLAAAVGPTGNLLIVMGKTKLHLFNNLIIIILNITLNILLIPAIGIGGAAIATAVSLASLNLLTLAEIYYMTRIQPFSIEFLKITVVAIGIAGMLSIFFQLRNLWTGLIFFTGYIVLYIIVLRLWKCFNKDDRIILREFEKRYQRSLSGLKRALGIDE